MLIHQNVQTLDCDKLSALPEPLLSKILSYLPTEDAIKTSILSPRWRFLWTTVSTLNFNDEKIYQDELRNEAGKVIDEVSHIARIKCFVDYVNNVLLQLKSTSVEKFSVSLRDCNDRLQHEDWISAAVKLNVRYLSLDMIKNTIEFPRQVFDCKLLETLILHHGVFVNKEGIDCFRNLKFLSLTSVFWEFTGEGNSAWFPKLETLILRHVRFGGKCESVTVLIRNCPLLKDLLIGKYVECGVSSYELCVPELTSAELTFRPASARKVEIDAPIKYLSIVDFNPIHSVFVKNPDNLITAEVTMSNIITEYRKVEQQRVLYDFQGQQKENVFDFMKMLEEVKCLNLGGYTDTVIRASQIELPIFCNLTRLEVDLICKNSCVLHCLLNNSNKLQTLVITENRGSCCIEDGPWMEFSPVPKCLLTSLKWVEIQNSTGCTHKLDMIKNMLKCAEILKKLTIKNGCMDDGVMSTQRQEILTSPRASAACVVDFPSL